MVIQKRWLCATCRREWVHAMNWAPEEGCPGCRSSAIELVEFAAPFAGADIPREPPKTITLPMTVPVDLPGLGLLKVPVTVEVPIEAQTVVQRVVEPQAPPITLVER